MVFGQQPQAANEIEDQFPGREVLGAQQVALAFQPQRRHQVQGDPGRGERGLGGHDGQGGIAVLRRGIDRAPVATAGGHLLVQARQGKAGLLAAQAALSGQVQGLDQIGRLADGRAQQGQAEGQGGAGAIVPGRLGVEVQDIGPGWRRIAPARVPRGRRGLEDARIDAVAGQQTARAGGGAGDAGGLAQAMAQQAPPGGPGIGRQADGVQGAKLGAQPRQGREGR